MIGRRRFNAFDMYASATSHWGLEEDIKSYPFEVHDIRLDKIVAVKSVWNKKEDEIPSKIIVYLVGGHEITLEEEHAHAVWNEYTVWAENMDEMRAQQERSAN